MTELNEQIRFVNVLDMEFVWIDPGLFMMGEEKRKETIGKGFYMQTTEVTQRNWKEMMRNNPSHFKDCDDCPVETVSWDDVQEFVRKLNQKTGEKYRLPTEAEWEYTCRAGSTTDFCFGDDENMLNEYTWYYNNSDRKTNPVGQKRPNAWGLYDMHGNVHEWCQDKGDGSNRVFRGGSWYMLAKFCRSAIRGSIASDFRHNLFGFRLLKQGEQ